MSDACCRDGNDGTASLPVTCRCCWSAESFVKVWYPPGWRCLGCVDSDPKLPSGDRYIAHNATANGPQAAAQLELERYA